MYRNKNSKSCTLEDIPGEVIYTHIFPYLDPQDIYNLGCVSQSMKKVVVDKSLHPLTMYLQYLKTRDHFLKKQKTIYDNSDGNFSFRQVYKCSIINNKNKCECYKFRYRKEWVIIDPAFCLSCNRDEIINCNDCCMLMSELFNRNLCKACYVSDQDLCKDCTNQIEK